MATSLRPWPGRWRHRCHSGCQTAAWCAITCVNQWQVQRHSTTGFLLHRLTAQTVVASNVYGPVILCQVLARLVTSPRGLTDAVASARAFSCSAHAENLRPVEFPAGSVYHEPQPIAATWYATVPAQTALASAGLSITWARRDSRGHGLLLSPCRSQSHTLLSVCFRVRRLAAR